MLNFRLVLKTNLNRTVESACIMTSAITDSDTAEIVEPPSLMLLNDDVLALILSQLHEYRQFEMAQMHSRLDTVVSLLWRTQIKNVYLDEKMLRRAAATGKQFTDFLLRLSPYLKGLRFLQVNVKRLNYLRFYTLSGVTSLEWVIDKKKRGCVLFLDKHVRLISTIFPALRTLKLRGCHLTGKYLTSLLSLEELCLSGCHFLESRYFRDIFGQLNLKKFDIMNNCDEVNCCDLIYLHFCPSLEHVKIADYHLCMESDITQQLFLLPNLSKLSIYSRNFVFDVLARVARPMDLEPGDDVFIEIRREVEGFRFKGPLHNYPRFLRELGNLELLKRLELYGQFDKEQDQLQVLEDRSLIQLSTDLTELTELRLCGFELETPAGISGFVANSRKLKILDITRSTCKGDALVWIFLDILTKQKWRLEPIELWICQSDISPEIINLSRCVDNEHLLKIDAKQLIHCEDYINGVLKFSFARRTPVTRV